MGRQKSSTKASMKVFTRNNVSSKEVRRSRTQHNVKSLAWTNKERKELTGTGTVAKRQRSVRSTLQGQQNKKAPTVQV